MDTDARIEPAVRLENGDDFCVLDAGKGRALRVKSRADCEGTVGASRSITDLLTILRPAY